MSTNKHKLELVTLPSENLRKPSEKIKFPLPEDFSGILENMARICREHNGVGIAAPQIGLNIRAVIINLEHMDVPAFPLINPEIVKYSKETDEAEEGCLSIPGKFAIVKRSIKIDVKAQNLEGDVLEFKADGFLARVIQHEVDHINGILFVDRLDPKLRDQLTKEFYEKSQFPMSNDQ